MDIISFSYFLLFQVDELLVDMLLDGQDLSLVQKISGVIPNLHCNIHSTTTQALSSIITKARLVGNSRASLLNVLCEYIHKHYMWRDLSK